VETRRQLFAVGGDDTPKALCREWRQYAEGCM